MEIIVFIPAVFYYDRGYNLIFFQLIGTRFTLQAQVILNLQEVASLDNF